jgi:hypothetical protein
MMEIRDVRAEPFGYSAQEVLRLLWDLKFHWFKITQEGRLLPLTSPDELIHWPGYNVVAVPEECLEEVGRLLAEMEGECVR